MGNKSTHLPYPVEEKKEIKLKPYQSKEDKVFKKFETEFNLLKYLEIKDFQQILYNFTSTNYNHYISKNQNDGRIPMHISFLGKD